MDASMAEVQSVAMEEVRTGWLGLITRNPFGKKPEHTQAQAQVLLPEIRKRVQEERAVLRMNELSRHCAIHAWLMEHDAIYAKSAEFDAIYAKIGACIDDLRARLEALLAQSGHTRTEIAIAFDHRTGTLSDASLASVDRLIDAYSSLYQLQDMLCVQLDKLNALAEGAMFMELKLCRFTQVQPPECRDGITYAALSESLHKGTLAVYSALEQLNAYIRSIKHKESLDRILREYRDAVWADYLSSGQFAAHSHVTHRGPAVAA